MSKEEQRKEHSKALKRERAKLLNALDGIIIANIALKELGEVVDVKKAKPAATKKAKPEPVVEPEVEPEEPWVCAGNVLSGDACPAQGKGTDVRAVDTRHDHKIFVTCRACKKAISATRALQRTTKDVLDIEPEVE